MALLIAAICVCHRSTPFFGGVLAFSGVHAWTADTKIPDARAAWVNNLNTMVARKPQIAVPGHLTLNAQINASSIRYTRDYLLAYEQELTKADDSAAVIEAMTRLYPDAGMGIALKIGAKIAKGEMEWG